MILFIVFFDDWASEYKVETHYWSCRENWKQRVSFCPNSVGVRVKFLELLIRKKKKNIELIIEQGIIIKGYSKCSREGG